MEFFEAGGGFWFFVLVGVPVLHEFVVRGFDLAFACVLVDREDVVEVDTRSDGLWFVAGFFGVGLVTDKKFALDGEANERVADGGGEVDELDSDLGFACED